ncbi:MAG: PAS domain S-box protein, partial [Kiritimatiellaeota bacterium]|nr:PAS domain S-box protein [Kiritimatiellota bacterium]
MNLREIIPADRIPMWEQLLQRAIKQGRYSDEYFRSDHPKYFERTFNPVVEEGQATRVAIFARDITARKRAETALLESEEKFLRLAGHIESVLYSLDATTREFRYLSPAFEKLFGYSVEDIQLMGGRRAFLAHVIQGDQFKEQDRYLADVQLEDQATSFRTESWWRCKDGSLRYTQDHWMPVYEQDKLVSTEGILTDITKEKAADDKLKASEARLKDAQRLAKLGSWNWDLVSQQITWSDELYAIWGFDRGAPPSSLVQYMKLFLPKALLDL